MHRRMQKKRQNNCKNQNEIYCNGNVTEDKTVTEQLQRIVATDIFCAEWGGVFVQVKCSRGGYERRFPQCL